MIMFLLKTLQLKRLTFAKYKKNTNGNNKLRKTYDRSDRVNKGGVGGSFKKTNGYGLKMIPLRMTMIGVTISNLK